MSRIGLRINQSADNIVAEDVLSRLSKIGVAQISDCMGRLYGSSELVTIGSAELRVAGIALTVKVPPGDNLLIHQAIVMGRRGEVLVVDGAGCTSNALVGELMMLQAREHGLRGFVIDGAVRDAAAFAAEGFPCFARAVSHRGPYKNGPGEINVPVSVGGLVVQPGDVVLGDGDGVLAIPPAYAESVLAAAEDKERAEQSARERIAAGRHDKPWLSRTLDMLKGEYA